jgi:fibronectin type III domain protein
MKMNILILFFLSLFVVSCIPPTQVKNKYDYSKMDSKTKEIHQIFEVVLDSCIKNDYPISIPRYTKIDTIITNEQQKFIDIHLNRFFAFSPIREKDVMLFYQAIHEIYDDFDDYVITVFSNKTPVQQLIPNFYRSSESYYDQNRIPKKDMRKPPLVRNISNPWKPEKGLYNSNIALWHSHGWYYEQRLNRWEWQRARLFQVVEDIGPMAFTVPYIIPMLENAGANVFVPRERDLQTNEAIVDNDTFKDSLNWYSETTTKNLKWQDGATAGFSIGTLPYRTGDNPFQFGTFRQVKADSESTASINWVPIIPKAGEYDVNISFAHSDSNITDAHYTVYHNGGKTEFLVNQQMGGKSWIFLGKFKFNEGQIFETGRVELINKSEELDKYVTADAVRFGGGMGVVSRGGSTSGRPKFVEAARYYLQFAGMPDTLVYNLNNDTLDYNDDYQSRGEWVNYLKGAPFGPNRDREATGLGIPVDLSLAFHTDAGISKTDTVIGTLSIYSTQDAETSFVYPNGVSRNANRDFADILQTQIVQDLRKTWDPVWNRRGLWDRMYSEAYRPNVPAALLELFSHQNLLDVKFYHDPQYRFDVSRSIYKSMLKFISVQNNVEYVVQPLPVTHMQAEFTAENQVILKWQPKIDALELTANPEKYILYTSIAENGFDNGVLVDATEYIVNDIQPDMIYNFKVTAINKGGESFPSEILSVALNPDIPEPVLIVNGFDRVSGPAVVETENFAGFANFIDAGVPDKYSLEYTGEQFNFTPPSKWTDDDSPGFGASYADFETTIIPGNTFNYPNIHGKSILNAGYSFVSCSDESVIDENIDLNKYKIVDMIYGEEKSTDYPKPRGSKRFEVFPHEMQNKITDYLNSGGNMFISGSYIASDLYTQDIDSVNIKFAVNTLKLKLRTKYATKTGNLSIVDTSFAKSLYNLSFNTTYDTTIYAAEAPNGIEPADSLCRTFLRYKENNISAGIVYDGKYKLIATGFPFETILNLEERNLLMKNVLECLKD